MVVNPSQIHKETNPLASLMRQPKVYIKLPSQGEFWPEGSLVMPETKDLPVYSMTAKDELLLKIPDAVMSGQAVVDVIQNCVPNIKNAWMIPNIDLDVILIAIRLATYGEKMVTPLKLGEDLEMEYSVDLRIVMDDLMSRISWNPVVSVNEDITIFVRPINYKQISESAVKTFETQKIMQVVNDERLPEAEKIEAFKSSFKKLTEVTIGIVQDSIYRIDSTQGSTDNPEHIKEFIENADKSIFNAVQEHLDNLREQNSVRSITVDVTDEMRSKGVTGDRVDIPLVFDPATFFV